MGVVVMGPPSTGKTTIIQLLSRVMTFKSIVVFRIVVNKFCIFQALTTNNNIKIHKINPKAQSRSQLLGKVDLDTRQWIDGIISKAAQQAYSENPGKNDLSMCNNNNKMRASG